MKTAFGILARDLKLLLRNPVALLVVGALLVLPGLYAWYCIIANWDPYSNTGEVPVAIVNNDAGVKSDLTGEVNIGEQVLEQLKGNDSIDWHFVDDEQEALEGTRAGVYYAAIVFPETLSQDVVGIFEGSKAQPTVYYYPNQKINAVATKVTDSAAQTLTRQVNQAFASQVNAVILQAVQKGAHGAEDSASQVQAGALAEVTQVQEDIREVLASLDDAMESIAAWRIAVAGGQETLRGVDGQLPAIRDALNRASGDIASLNRKTGEFSGTLMDTLLKSNQEIGRMSADTSSRVATAAADVQELSGGIEGIIGQLRGLREMAEQLAEILPEGELRDQMLQVVAEVDSTLETLEQVSGDTAAVAKNAAAKASETNDAVQQSTEEVAEASRAFTGQILPELSAGTDSLSRSAAGLSGAVGQFEPQVAELSSVLTQVDDALEQATGAMGQARVLLEDVGSDLAATTTDLGAIGSALEVEKISELLDVSPDNVGQFVSSPVHMVTEKVYPVSNYGTAVAPFYTNLALWIGCFILVSIIRLEVDRRGFESATPTQRYFGRWLLLAILAVLQSQSICGVDILLGIDCANPAWFMLAGAVASFCYMNLIYALAITFRNIGKTLCILILIMQVPGSSGMYPIEMMPGFFQAIHPFLPFTYGIQAMREALCGMYGTEYAGSLLVLASLVPASLLLGLGLRPHLMNLTQLFDEEMGKVGFFATEEHGTGTDSRRIRAMLRTLANSDEHRDEVENRALRFNRSYPRLRRLGSIALFAIPFGFLFIWLPFNVFMGMDADTKLGSLMIMLVLLLLTQAGLIVLEYVHRTIAEETRLLDLSLLDEVDYATLLDQADDARKGVEQQLGRVHGEIGQRLEQVKDEARERVGAHVASAPLAAGRPAAHAAGSGWKQARDDRRRHGAVREIFLTDMRLGFQSVIGVVVMLLLVITPSMYAWFNIAGSWDPYSNTGGLKVAVANEDEGYKGDLLPLTVNVGDTVVSQLRGNNSFDWQFVSNDQAMEGIQSGEYYASIVIPADFSRNMMTYLTDDAAYPDVFYYTNEKENPIAPLITQKGADSIQENIRETFTERVDEVGLTMATDVLEYVTQPRVSDYALKMGGHLDDAVDDMQSGATEMRSLADLSGIVSGVVVTAGAAMDGVSAAGDAAKESLAEAESGVSSATAAFDDVAAVVERALSQGEGGLDELAADADAALAALQERAGDVPEHLTAVRDRVVKWEDMLTGVQELLFEEAQDPELSPEDREELRAAAQHMQPSIDSLAKIHAALDRSIVDGQGGSENIAQLRAELQDLVAEARAGSGEARAYYDDNVKGTVADLKATMGSVAESAHIVTEGLESSLGGLSESTGGLANQLSALSGQLGRAAAQLDSAAVRVANAKDRVNDALQSKDVAQISQVLLGGDATVLAQRLAAPVSEKTEAIFPVMNYGSSMAPFYTVLSLWVGALVMISTMKAHLTPERSEELRRRFRLKPRHEYLGRLGIFAFIALLQALLVSLGDLCLLHIQCEHPVLFVLACVYIGQVFNLIVFTFTELFGDVGKAVCIILLIMQVAASGGTFPVEMLGRLLGNVAPFLPFFHGMSALQGCVAGIYHGDTFVYLVLMFGYVIIMFLMGLVARKPFRFVTNWVEAQLEKTHYL